MAFAKLSSILMLSSASITAKNKRSHATIIPFQVKKNTNLSNPEREEGTIPSSSGGGGGHVLEDVSSCSDSLAHLIFSYVLTI
jgi:hypothetical protein